MAMPIREHASTMKEALNISVNTITWLSDFSHKISGQSGDSTMEEGTNWTVVEIEAVHWPISMDRYYWSRFSYWCCQMSNLLATESTLNLYYGTFPWCDWSVTWCQVDYIGPYQLWKSQRFSFLGVDTVAHESLGFLDSTNIWGFIRYLIH